MLVALVPLQSVKASTPTLFQLIKTAIKNDRNINAYNHEKRANEYRLEATGSNYYPQLSLAGSGSHNNQQGDVDSKINDLRMGLTLTQTIYDESIATKQKAESSVVDEVIYKIADKKQKIAYAVGNAYLSAVEYQKNAKVNEEHILLAKQQMEIAQRRLGAGEITKNDLLQAKSNYLNLVSEQAQTTLKINQEFVRMQSLAGVKMSQDLLTTPVFRYKFTDLTQKNVEAQVFERPDVLMLRTKLKTAAAVIEQEKAKYLPTFAFTSEYEVQTGRDLIDELNYKRNVLTLGLTFAMPIDLSGKIGYGIKQKIEEQFKTREENKQVLNEAVRAVVVALENYKSYFASRDTLRNSIEITSQLMENTLKQYRAGLLTIRDLLRIQEDLYEASKNLVIVDSNILKTEWQMLQLLGKTSLPSLKEVL